jgi:hypothetical protein
MVGDKQLVISMIPETLGGLVMAIPPEGERHPEARVSEPHAS